MTIAYNLGIPNAPDNPSIDQPNMKTNNDNIATYVAVDHVGFNTAGSGQHNQITFHANNVPAVPTAPPVLFTNNDAFSLPQLFYYSGDAAHSSSQYVASPNGSTFLLGGIIIKWGMGALTGLPGPSVTFPVAFPNNCYSVTITGSSTLYTGGFVVANISPNGF